jgi:alpha-L-rhamnosidase
MWYVLCLYEFQKANPSTDFVQKSAKKIRDLLKYFKQFENEYELIEDMTGWIFVEWSKANTEEHVKGVNFPTNMLYYRTLLCAGEMYGDDELIEKAERIKRNIIKFSYNGEFFEDNAVREKGVLTLKRHLTEVCQYYAFDMGIATKETYPKLYDTLMKVFVPGKPLPQKYADIGRANVIIGLCIRQKLGLKYGDTELVLKMVKDIYYPMAERTLTLWEHVDERASCNHGIAAFAGVSIVSALTGYMGVKDGVAVFKKVDYKRNCRLVIPYGNATIKVAVKNKTLTVESKKIPYTVID